MCTSAIDTAPVTPRSRTDIEPVYTGRVYRGVYTGMRVQVYGYMHGGYTALRPYGLFYL